MLALKTHSTSCIRPQENAHPEAAFLVAGDFNADNLKLILPHFYQHVTCATRGVKNSRSPLLLTQTPTKWRAYISLESD
jgi:hypothetical protein